MWSRFLVRTDGRTNQGVPRGPRGPKNEYSSKLFVQRLFEKIPIGGSITWYNCTVLSASRFIAGMLKFIWGNIFTWLPYSVSDNESSGHSTTPAVKMSVPQNSPFSVYLRKVPIGSSVTWYNCNLQLPNSCSGNGETLRWPVRDWKQPTLWNDQNQRQKSKVDPKMR